MVKLVRVLVSGLLILVTGILYVLDDSIDTTSGIIS
jgi:hypothetical protein